MPNRNHGNGHLHNPAGLWQIGPVRHNGGMGYRKKNDSSAARKPKSITARVNIGLGHRKIKPKITLPTI